MPEIDDQTLANLQARADAADSAAAAADQHARQLADGVERFRAALARHNPDIPAAAITGDSFDAIEASVATARTIADAAVAAHTAAHPPAPPQPTPPPASNGAPPPPPATDGMSPAQKVAYGLGLRHSTKNAQV